MKEEWFPWLMGILTIVGLPIIAWLIILVGDGDFLQLFQLPQETVYALALFLGLGILFGLYMMWFGTLSYFDHILLEYKALMDRFKITGVQGVFLAISAGVGEEILFRGAIQPLLGIWITSLLFVGSHYILFKERLQRHTVLPFTIMILHLLLLSVVIGYIAQEFSLWHAMAFHFSYDLVQFMYLWKMQPETSDQFI